MKLILSLCSSLVSLCSLLVLSACFAKTPHEGTFRMRASDGVEIACESAGRGSPALLFVHGWGCDRTHWANEMKLFARDHRVASLDLAGHGESGGQRKNGSLSLLADDVVALVKELDYERVILVGHSLGGRVALEAAEKLPDRVAGVVVVDTLQNVEKDLDRERADAVLANLRKDYRAFVESFVRGAFHPGGDPALMQRVIDGALRVDPEFAAALIEAMVGWEQRAHARLCPCPIRAINASGPELTQVEVNRKYARDYDARLMDGVGHFPMLEQPEAFHRVLAEVVDELARKQTR